MRINIAQKEKDEQKKWNVHLFNSLQSNEINVCSFDCIDGWTEYGCWIWDNGGAIGWGKASDISIYIYIYYL